MDPPGDPAYTPRPQWPGEAPSTALDLPPAIPSARPTMPGKKLSPKETQEFDQLLRGLLGVLTGDIRNLESETISEDHPRGNVSAEDSGSEINAVELSLELLERDEKTVREIMEALDRIKAGSYGICEICDKAVKKTRLRYMPHARNCVDCQRAAEQGSHQ